MRAQKGVRQPKHHTAVVVNLDLFGADACLTDQDDIG